MNRSTLVFLMLAALLLMGADSPYDEAMELYAQGGYQAALERLQEAQEAGDSAEVELWMGWCLYRLERLDEAGQAFQSSLQMRPDHPEALTGLGYLELRADRTEEAAHLFRQALQGLPKSPDALLGMAYVAWRQDQHAQARTFVAQVLEVDAGNAEAQALLARLREEPEAQPVYPDRVPYRRPDTLQLLHRTAQNYFEVRTADGRWRPIFVQGMNLGAALPGKHPSEFPATREVYARWLDQMAAMGVNAVRVYTIHPPVFYQAFWDYNQHPGNPPLWLIHGVWTELPEGDDFRDPAFQSSFQAEMRRVVDLLHGQADLERRPGHAWGQYTADVSPWVLAYIIGREWEPFSVVEFNRLHAGSTYQGRYLGCTEGNPMEAWLAEMCDFMLDYEMSRYNAQRPISFTNWPTLDPISHVTEPTKAEEIQLLAERGERSERLTREYDNDGVGLSMTSFRPTPAYQAGLFASYHAYPYYPDFMNNDPVYAEARDSLGPNHYMGYLLALKEHYRDLPLLISEYGVPSSRGNAHQQPEGMDHGGHSERAQGEIDARLTQDLYEAGTAGGALFAWIDEWFKKNWAVIDVEIPLERNRLWLNPLDAEQNYGMLAMRPGKDRLRSNLVGDPVEWAGLEPLAASDGPLYHAFEDGSDGARDLRRLYVTSDEAYLYLRLDVAQLRAGDLAKVGYLIGIDTYDRSLGEHLMPFGTRAPTADGLEFVLVVAGPDDAELLVARDYRPFLELPIHGSGGAATYVRNLGAASRSRSEGDFRSFVVETNRRRIGRNRVIYPALLLNWGRLLRGGLRGDREDYTSLADWNYSSEAGMLEFRLPWGLLQVTDPSSHQVIHNPLEGSEVGTTTTDGMRFVAVSYARPSGGREAASTGEAMNIADALPAASLPLASTPAYVWDGWEVPSHHEEVKEAYFLMQKKFRSLGGEPPRP